jgi:hypothetical protein
VVSGPSARYAHAMAYDAASGATILFGGHTSGGPNTETWEWNGTGGGTWAQRVVSGPSARHAHAMAYDAARGLTVLFGGETAAGHTDETWEVSFPLLVYVNHAATGLNNGGSWSNAFTELRDALAFAAAQPSIREIWVAAGTYTPTTYTDPSSRSVSFNLQDNLAIYGGFAGTETDLSQRDIAANPTILSGDLNGDDDDGPNPNDNSFHVVRYGVVSSSSTLDGVTITSGNANSPGDREGAGVFAVGIGTPLFRNCNIQNNHADDRGGGVGVAGTSPLFTNCVISNNSAGAGGGAFHYWNL